MDKRRRDRKKRIRREIFARDDFTCRDCGWSPDLEDWDGISVLTDGERMLTVDHRVEKAAGGRSTKENFATLCNFCNTKKSVEFGRAISLWRERGLTLEQARLKAAIQLGILTVDDEPGPTKSWKVVNGERVDDVQAIGSSRTEVRSSPSDEESGEQS